MIAMWVHLFPSRTQKLSTSAPTILGGRLPVKIGNANMNLTASAVRFFLYTKRSREWCLAIFSILMLPAILHFRSLLLQLQLQRLYPLLLPPQGIFLREQSPGLLVDDLFDGFFRYLPPAVRAFSAAPPVIRATAPAERRQQRQPSPFSLR